MQLLKVANDQLTTARQYTSTVEQAPPAIDQAGQSALAIRLTQLSGIFWAYHVLIKVVVDDLLVFALRYSVSSPSGLAAKHAAAYYR